MGGQRNLTLAGRVEAMQGKVCISPYPGDRKNSSGLLNRLDGSTPCRFVQPNKEMAKATFIMKITHQEKSDDRPFSALSINFLFTFVLCSAVFMDCSSPAHAQIPPQPNALTGFVIAGDDSLLISTSYMKFYRGNSSGTQWTATTPKETPLLQRQSEKWVSARIRRGHVDYACDGKGVSQSKNGGLDWMPTGRLPDRSVMCTSLAYADEKLYSGTINGLYVSQDLGSTWKPVRENGKLTILNLFADDSHSVYASARTPGFQHYVSYRVEPETGWTLIDYGNAGLTHVQGNIAPFSKASFQPQLVGLLDHVLYASSRAGLMRSRDHGHHWESFQAGLPDPATSQSNGPLDVVFVIRKNAAGMLYVATWRGLYRYAELKKSWERLPLTGLRIGEAYFP
jgi:hypothetical protein